MSANFRPRSAPRRTRASSRRVQLQFSAFESEDAYERLERTIGIPATAKENRMLGLLAAAFAQNGDVGREEALLFLYRRARPHADDKPGFGELYAWYRSRRLSKDDELAFLTYAIEAKRRGVEGASPDAFSRRGGHLLGKLRDWAGRDCASDDGEILALFFSAACDRMEMNGFGSMLMNPIWFFTDATWCHFLQDIDRRFGGKESVLQFEARVDPREASALALAELRRRAVFDGDIARFDEIGRAMTDVGPVAAAERYGVAVLWRDPRRS